MQVAVDQRRRRQPTLRVERPRGVGVQVRANPGEAAVLHGEVDDRVADTHISDQEVHRVTVNR